MDSEQAVVVRLLKVMMYGKLRSVFDVLMIVSGPLIIHFSYTEC